jgi:hypothetical protein
MKDTEQFKTLMLIAKKKVKDYESLIGREVPNSPNETISMFISDRVEHGATYKNGYWDCPNFTAGTTRRAQGIFRVDPGHYPGDYGGCRYPQKFKDKYKKLSEFEKILITEYFGEDFVEIIWAWDWMSHEKAGPDCWGLAMEQPEIKVRINGIITTPM